MNYHQAVTRPPEFFIRPTIVSIFPSLEDERV
ncbi:hypothetical protein J2X14_000339 [Pantoea alhagi]|nr:hypothetical protein [Pantoea alhagi]